MRTSDDGLELIEELEGVRLKAYRDGGGVPTIGVGHTRGVKMGQTCTAEQARAWLREDVQEAEATIRRHLPAKVINEIPQRSYDALVSFAFNLGDQAFKNDKTGSLTGLARVLTACDWQAVPAQMGRWVFDNGKKVRGLENRRKREASEWNSGWEA